MTDLVPSDPRIDRPALERIIQRAAELQTREREIGEGLTDIELMELGEEVGILPQHLRQALSEERTRTLARSESGTLNRLVGPQRAIAQRVILGKASSVDTALSDWMTEGELLQIKRRFPDRKSWERKEGAFASIKRSFGAGGRKYVLAGAAEIVSRVEPVDTSRCRIQLVADLSNKRSGHVIGSSVLVGGGATMTGIALALGVVAFAAVIPVVVSVPVAVAVSRSYRREIEKFQVALEQVLDRLEHGDTEVQPKLIGPEGGVGRIANEIRKNLGI